MCYQVEYLNVACRDTGNKLWQRQWMHLHMLRVLRSPRSICTAGHGKGLKDAAMGAGPLPPVALPMIARSTCDGKYRVCTR